MVCGLGSRCDRVRGMPGVSTRKASHKGDPRSGTKATWFCTPVSETKDRPKP